MTGHVRPGPALLALDVDGVLLDPDRNGRGPWQAAFGQRFGVDGTRLDEAFFAPFWADVVIGQRPVESALADALATLGWNIDVESALQSWFDDDFVPDESVVAAAREWAAGGVPLALVSNQEPRRARFLEQRLADLLPLSGAAFSGDLGALKGDAGFYARAERHLGITGTGRPVVFLDDTRANVEAARRHGWIGIHFTGGADWQVEVTAALARVEDHPLPA